MSVSRKSPGVVVENEIYELSQECYDESKRACQERSGYPVSDTEMSQKAVDEKLPSGSQSY